MDELYIADGSIGPTSLGVNPQLAIMSIATGVAWRMRERPIPLGSGRSIARMNAASSSHRQANVGQSGQLPRPVHRAIGLK